MLQNLLSPDFFNAILRATTPILFAALASSVASKSGITNMALEGIMLFSALFGVIFSAMSGNWAVGLLLTMAAGGIIGLLLAVSVFLISNTVTIGINVRREEITIMKYIGATDFFVRFPFVVEGILIGLVGAGIPLAIIYVVYNKAVTYVLERFSILTNLLAFLPVSEIYHILLPLSLGIGVGIGFLGSFITVRKHLRV